MFNSMLLKKALSQFSKYLSFVNVFFRFVYVVYGDPNLLDVATGENVRITNSLFGIFVSVLTLVQLIVHSLSPPFARPSCLSPPFARPCVLGLWAGSGARAVD